MINFDFELLSGIGLSETLARHALEAAGAERDERDPADAALALMRVIAVHRSDRAASRRPLVARRRASCRACCAATTAPMRSPSATGCCVGARCRRPTSGCACACEPTSHIARRDGDGSRHPIVSNVDRALVVMGLDDDFNLRRLERYLSLVVASGVAPVVVLSKADVAAARPACSATSSVAQLRKRLPPGLEVVIVDGTDPGSATGCSRISPASARRWSSSARRARANRP